MVLTGTMNVIRPRAAGADVHEMRITATVRPGSTSRNARPMPRRA